MSSITRSNLLFGVGICLCNALPALGELTWQEKSIRLDAKLGEQKTVVSFPFSNGANTAITIRQIATSCSCTAAKLDKKVFEPGEAGKIDVAFAHEARVGVQKKSVIVITDDPVNPNIELNLTVNIPEWVEIKPAFVMWKTRSPDQAKELHVKLGDPGMVLLKVNNDSKDFEVKISDDNGELKVLVKPKSTEKPVRSGIDVTVRLPDKSIRKFQAYAVVK